MDKYLKAFLKNQKEVIQEIYTVCYPQIVALVCKNSGSAEDAPPLFNLAMQAMFDKAQQDPEHFPKDEYFKNFFFVVCRNQWLKVLRSRKRIKTFEKPDDGEVTVQSDPVLEGIEELLIQNERWALFYKHLQRMSDRCKKLLDLSFGQYKMKEIAEQMGWETAQVAKNEVGKCRAKLDDQIKSDPLYDDLKFS